MLPSEIRNRVFTELRSRLEGDRLTIHSAMLRNGPCTCRALSAILEMDLNSVAPRVCELVKVGLARLNGLDGRRGLYIGVPLEAACAMLCEQMETARQKNTEQLLMPL